MGISFRPIDTQKEPINKTFTLMAELLQAEKKTKQFNLLMKVETAYQNRIYNLQGLLSA